MKGCVQWKQEIPRLYESRESMCALHTNDNFFTIYAFYEERSISCLFSSSSISMWGPIKANSFLKRVIQYLQNIAKLYMLD